MTSPTPERPTGPVRDIDERAPIQMRILDEEEPTGENVGMTEAEAREFLARKVDDEGIPG